MRATFIAVATVFVLVALVLLLNADPQNAQQNPATTSSSKSAEPFSFAQRISLSGVSNFGEVTPTLARGGQPTLPGFEALAHRGVAIVVDLREEGDRASERAEVEKLGMQYVALPWTCQHPSDERVARFLQILRDNPEKKLFVHCHYGVDRTGLMIAVYRMAEQGWTAAQAKREMEAFGFDAMHRTWCRGVGSYENSFPQKFSLDPAFQLLRPATQPSANAAPR
jgi:tyrosine-protein phosphatase SIW14